MDLEAICAPRKHRSIATATAHLSRWLIFIASIKVLAILIAGGIPLASAAAPTPSTTVKIQAITLIPAAADTPNDPYYALRVSPPPLTCRYSLVFISSVSAGSAQLREAAQLAKATSSKASISYSQRDNGVCLVSSITPTTGSGDALPPTPLSFDADTALPGYIDKHVTAFKAAYRDFGQNKLDEKVDPISGKLTLTHVDVAIPGANGMDIRVVRQYVSPDPEQVASSIVQSVASQIYGMGWDIVVGSGGVRNNYRACPQASGDGPPLDLRALPQWIDENGNAEPMVPSPQFGWVSASGARLNCVGLPTVTTPDGKTIALMTDYRAFADPTTPYRALPTKITDRWGNWLAFEYDMQYVAEIDGVDVGVFSQQYSKLLPLKKVTSSDGRVVFFDYYSKAPGWTPASGTNFYDWGLQRIRYGSYSVQYDYARLSSLGGYPKYWLTNITMADGHQWAFDYNYPAFANVQQACSPAVGVAALRSVILPEGGISRYTWGQSLRSGPRYVCGNSIGATVVTFNTNQLRTKTTTDGGLWQYSYTDSANPAQTIPPPFAGAVPFTFEYAPFPQGNGGYEAGRITGPDNTQIFYHHPRYSLNRSGAQGIVGFTFEPRRLGRPFQHDTFENTTTLNTAKERRTFTYQDAFVSQQALTYGDPAFDEFVGSAVGVPQDGVTSFLMWPLTTTLTRAGSSYSTSRAYTQSACARPFSLAEVGTRSRTREYTYDATAYCQISSERLKDSGGTIITQMARTFTADGRGVATETLYGPTLASGLTKSFGYFPYGDTAAAGEVATIDDARGYRTYFLNYKLGTPRTELHPVTQGDANAEPAVYRITLTRSVDDLGRVVSETDGEGRSTLLEYNGAHKPTLITLPRTTSHRELRFAYGATLDTITRGTGATIGRTETISRDGFGRVTHYNNAGIQTSYAYDTAGRLSFVSYPDSAQGQSRRYDALGRTVLFTEPDPQNPSLAVNTNIAFDDANRTVSVTNARGATHVYTLDAFGDPSDGWTKAHAIPDVGTQTIERNLLGQITKLSLLGVDRLMSYDASRGYFLSTETHPELGTITYGRDNNGNLTSRQVAGSGATSTTYDGQNRPVTVTPAAAFPATPTLINYWFKTGLIQAAISSVASDNITRVYTYDDNNNLTQETVTIDGTARALNYQYDLLDSLASTTYPSGRTVSHAPDALGRPTQATLTSGGTGSIVSIVSNATYWPSGLPRTLSYQNGVAQDFTEQSARPLVNGLTIKKGSAAAALALGYQYDTVANLTGVTDATNRGYARSVSYDLFDRLRTDNSETITYTGVGDINTKTGTNGVASSYLFDANKRLQSISGNINRSYSYDVYGNAASDGRFNFQHDAFNALRTASTSSGTVASYDYDAHQHLAKKVSAGQTTHYLYGKSGRLFAEYNLSTNASKDYIHLGNKLVGQIATSGASTVTGCGFNVEGVGLTTGDFTSDGVILARYARGLTNQALIANTRADQNPANLTAVINAINAHMSAYSGAHDIDASGGALTENDAILINRYLAGFRGNALTQGLTLTGTRTNAGDIQTYINSGCPTTAGNGATTTTFIHPNLTGSPIMATNASGDPAWFENYSAFGERLKNENNANAGSNSNQNWFIGKPVDSATGLVYFGARWYDPQVARFLSFDPAPVSDTNPHSFNRYAYGNNNPYKYLDPDGRQAVQLGQALARAAAPASVVGDTVRAGGSAPIFDPATGVMSNPAQGPSLPNIGGFLAAANAISVMFTPMAVIDRMAGVMTSMMGPRNGHLAGSVHPVTGIPFDKNGFPDFSSVSKADVQISQTGSRAGDFAAANKSAGFKSTPDGFTWHHHQDKKTMQLVPTDIHSKTGHTGGFKEGTTE